MKTKIRGGLLFFFLISLIFSCQPQTDRSADRIDMEQIKKEIQEREDEFAKVYNSGELKEIGYYADDAISFSQNSPPLVGREQIIEYLVANLDSMSVGNKISFTTKEVYPSNDANQVLEVGYYKVIDSEGIAINTGYYMTLFEKRDGKYVSLRDMSASDMTF